MFCAGLFASKPATMTIEISVAGDPRLAPWVYVLFWSLRQHLLTRRLTTSTVCRLGYEGTGGEGLRPLLLDSRGLVRKIVAVEEVRRALGWVQAKGRSRLLSLSLGVRPYVSVLRIG